MDLGTLRQIPIDQITYDLGNRGRSFYGDIPELQESIREYGLITPIAVYSPTLQPPYRLLGGGRRLMAVIALGWTEISCRIYDRELTEQQMLAIELFENLRREDLTFYDEVNMKAKLHRTLVEMRGEKIGRKPDSPGHSQADTAKLLGVSAATITQDLKLAQAIVDYPQLKLQENAKNKLQAMRIVERFETRLRDRAQAKKIQTQLAPTIQKPKPKEVESPVTKPVENPPELSQKVLDLLDCYIPGDFFANQLHELQFSCIEVDPPYGIDIANLRKSGSLEELKHDYVEIDEKHYFEFLQRLCKECYKLAAENSWIVLWCGPQYYQDVMLALEDARWEPNIVPGIWKKGNSPGQTFSPSTNLGNSYEMFVYARKGKAQLRQLGRSNIFDFAGVPNSQRIHSTERPRELIKEILTTFAWPKARILVPFAGSGNTMIAAHELGMESIGYDIARGFHDAYIARVMKEFGSAK